MRRLLSVQRAPLWHHYRLLSYNRTINQLHIDRHVKEKSPQGLCGRNRHRRWASQREQMWTSIGTTREQRSAW